MYGLESESVDAPRRLHTLQTTDQSTRHDVICSLQEISFHTIHNHGTCSDSQGLPPPEGYNEEWLAGFVERLSAFDRDMNTVVQNSRILAGVPPPALFAAGAALQGPHPQSRSVVMLPQLSVAIKPRCIFGMLSVHARHSRRDAS